MIKIEFSIGGGTEQVAPGVDSFSFPYFETVVGESYEIGPSDLYMYINGAYRGHATITFNLEHVNWFEIRDAETGRWINRYERTRDPNCNIFQFVENRYRFQSIFRSPKEPGKPITIGRTDHLLYEIDEIISIKGMYTTFNRPEFDPDQLEWSSPVENIIWEDNEIKMIAPTKFLCNLPIEVTIEYRKK